MALTTRPLTELSEFPADPGVNVARLERVASVAGGAALAAFGLTRRSLGGALLALAGGAFLYRGVTGRCALYRGLHVTTAADPDARGVPGNAGLRVESRVRVTGRTPFELYQFWRQLGNLPSFMPHLESVTEQSEGRSHWVVKGPAGSHVSWDAEVIAETPGLHIAWQSLPGAQVRNAGSVWFEPAADGSGTDVKVALEYLPPAGAAGALLARIFGRAPEQQLADDLARFKAAMEANAGE